MRTLDCRRNGGANFQIAEQVAFAGDQIAGQVGTVFVQVDRCDIGSNAPPDYLPELDWTDEDTQPSGWTVEVQL
jgi:hypothetical protein